MNIKEEIIELEKKIEDIKARIPAHSVKPEMIRALEELEEELSEKRKLNPGIITEEYEKQRTNKNEYN